MLWCFSGVRRKLKYIKLDDFLCSELSSTSVTCRKYFVFLLSAPPTADLSLVASANRVRDWLMQTSNFKNRAKQT